MSLYQSRIGVWRGDDCVHDRPVHFTSCPQLHYLHNYNSFTAIFSTTDPELARIIISKLLIILDKSERTRCRIGPGRAGKTVSYKPPQRTARPVLILRPVIRTQRPQHSPLARLFQSLLDVTAHRSGPNGIGHGTIRVMSNMTKLWRSTESDKRTFRRAELEVSAKFIFKGQPRDCHVANITPGGACIVPDDMAGILEGSSGALDLSGYGLVPARSATPSVAVSVSISRAAQRNSKPWQRGLGPPPPGLIDNFDPRDATKDWSQKGLGSGLSSCTKN